MLKIKEKFYNFLEKIKINLNLYSQTNSKTLVVNIVLGVIYFILFYHFKGFFDTTEKFFLAITPIVVNLLSTYVDLKLSSDKIYIMGLSVDSMNNSVGVTLDDVLEILMSYRYKKNIIAPTKPFFNSITELSNMGKPEDIRKVTEALPALFRLNSKRTKILIERELRSTFDADAWHDDNRRRTIEAFRFFPRSSNRFVEKMLRLIERDSVYSIIAILETILLSKKFHRRTRSHLISQLKADVKKSINNRTLDTNVNVLIDEIVLLTEKLKETAKNSEATMAEMQSAFADANASLYFKVFIAKNILIISKSKQKCLATERCIDNSCIQCIISLFDTCYAKTNHKNIRRPMAKEDVCFCLINMLSTTYKESARERLMLLIQDDDPIIARTTFDYMRKIINIDPKLYKDMLDYCINQIDKTNKWSTDNEKDARQWRELKERAENMYKKLPPKG